MSGGACRRLAVSPRPDGVESDLRDVDLRNVDLRNVVVGFIYSRRPDGLINPHAVGSANIPAPGRKFFPVRRRIRRLMFV